MRDWIDVLALLCRLRFDRPRRSLVSHAFACLLYAMYRYVCTGMYVVACYVRAVSYTHLTLPTIYSV